MENPNVTYGNSYSKKALTSEAAAIAQNLSKGLIKYGKGMPVDEYTNTFIKHSGLQPSDIQDYLEGKPSAVSSMLKRIHDQVLSTSGIDTWGDKLKGYQFINWNRDTFDFSSSRFLTEAYADKNYAFCSDFLRILSSTSVTFLQYVTSYPLNLRYLYKTSQVI